MDKQVIEETQEICSLCGGRGQERSFGTTTIFTNCRQCCGSGYVVTKRIVRTVIESPQSVEGETVTSDPQKSE